MRAVGEVTSRRMADYGRRHGYELRCYSSLLDQSLHPSWNKVLALRAVLNETRSDWVFWLDADALILSLKHRLDNLIDERYKVIAGSDRNGLCAGVMLVRNCPWSLRLLDALLLLGDVALPLDRYGYKAEQNTLKLLIASFPAIKENICLLDQRVMNSYRDDYADDDFVLHLHSLSNRQRLEIIERKLRALTATDRRNRNPEEPSM
jgi:hypothetical protein